MTIAHFTKRGAGRQNGDDWPNAAELDALAGHLRMAQADDLFLLGFDRDREDPVFYAGAPVVLSASGTPEKPIRLEVGYVGHAVDVQPQRGPGRHVFFKNPAASTKRGASSNRGSRFLTLQNGASHLRLAGFRLEGASADGFMKFAPAREASPFEDIVIQGLSATNVGRVIECEPDTVINGLIIEDCDAAQIARGFARFRTINESVFRNLFFDAAAVDPGGPNICQLIHVERGQKLAFTNVIMRNAMNMIGGGANGRGTYVQGDGIVTERGTSDVVLRNCHGSGMGDSAFDLKATGVTLEDCSAYRCKFGVRLWSDGANLLRRCAIGNPRTTGGNRGVCIQIGGQADIVDCVLQAGPGTAVFSFNGEPDAANRAIRVFGGSIHLDGDAALVDGPARGTVELHDVVVNGALRNQNYAYAGSRIF
jgi:hypothetical protein